MLLNPEDSFTINVTGDPTAMKKDCYGNRWLRIWAAWDPTDAWRFDENSRSTEAKNKQ